MAAVSMISMVRNDRYQQLVKELRSEYHCEDVGALADRIVADEAADFHWAARIRDRYLGQWLDGDRCLGEGGEDFARMAIMSFLGGRWHAGSCVVDGEGRAVELLWLQSFEGIEDAEGAFAYVR